jgi:DNA-binding MarR family transcriptional regulator/ribosomal protein S18 acetylase RimI-like enzyme
VDQVAIVRHFNRTYTPRIGALDDSFLGSRLPLAAARLLFEIGPDGAGVLELRRRLGLDSGYVSRLLRRLEDAELVTVGNDPGDRRRRLCRLTPAGRRRWIQLDRRSDAVAEHLLAPLTPGQRARLTEALATAGRLLRAAAVAYEPVDPIGAAATAAMTAYFTELDGRFPNGFDAGDALGPGAAAMAAPHGVFLLAAADDGTTVACGGVQRLDTDTAEIKRMWVDPNWRGTGIGRRMLTELEGHARRLGYARVVLDTNATLTEAIAMYAGAGYQAIPRYNDNPYAERWFTKRLT